MKINLFIFFLLPILITLASCGQATEKESPEQPNIIWIMAEDIGNDLECYGTKGVQTPRLNMLAENGAMYTNCICTSPICSPNRSAMMVGVHQNILNAQHHRSNRDVPLMAPYKPITSYLRRAGYTCILGHRKLPKTGGKIDTNYKIKGMGQWDGERNFGLFDKRGEFTTGDQPFFNQIQIQVTHRGDWWDDVSNESADPVAPDQVILPPYLADHPTIREDWAKYLDQIEEADKQVGMILDELEEKGMADNTIIIFIGDNGRCNIKGKNHVYDSGLRVPLIVYWPAGQEKMEDHIDDRLVSTTDISASILHLARVDIPDYMTAIPFIGIDNPEERDFVYSARDLADEILERSRAITTREFRYIRNYITDQSHDAHQAYLEFYRPALHMMRKLKKEGRLTPVQEAYFAPVKAEEELFDLISDPHETKNLAGDPAYAGILNDMRKKMDSWQEENHDWGLDPVNWENMVLPVSVDVLDWVIKTKPELYKQMLDGMEIGFQALADEYRTALK